MTYSWFNPKEGKWNGSGSIQSGIIATLDAPDDEPWVLVATRK
jgi:hypothetical protein